MFLDALILLTAALVLYSKYLDCRTTADGISTPAQERNPLARRCMERYGMKTTIWGIFAVLVVFVGVALYGLFAERGDPVDKVLFCIMGLILAYCQFAVARTNATGRLNGFTRILSKIYGR